MNFPQIGDTITTERAIELCRFFKFDFLVERISFSPEKYTSWRFDGCSLVPERLAAQLMGVQKKDLMCVCLKHDLKYGYGRAGDAEERLKADYELGLDLLAVGAKAMASRSFFESVRLGGGEWGLSFSWGFAEKKK